MQLFVESSVEVVFQEGAGAGKAGARHLGSGAPALSADVGAPRSQPAKGEPQRHREHNQQHYDSKKQRRSHKERPGASEPGLAGRDIADVGAEIADVRPCHARETLRRRAGSQSV